MSWLQWLLLLAAVGAVVFFYLRARRARDEDPWKSAPPPEQGVSGVLPDYEQQDAADSTTAAARRPLIVDMEVEAEYERQRRATTERDEPQLDDDGSWQGHAARPDPQLGLDIEPAVEDRRRSSRPVAAPPGQEQIIVLHVTAKAEQWFTGNAIHTALQLCKLRFGMRDIYHRITEVNGVPEAVFSVASMVKPGHLDPLQAEGFSTPGLTLFMVLPGPIEGVMAFRDMLDSAQRLATRLGGEVLDDKRSLLTHQTEQYLFDQIAELERRWRVQPRRK